MVKFLEVCSVSYRVAIARISISAMQILPEFLRVSGSVGGEYLLAFVVVIAKKCISLRSIWWLQSSRRVPTNEQ